MVISYRRLKGVVHRPRVGLKTATIGGTTLHDRRLERQSFNHKEGACALNSVTVYKHLPPPFRAPVHSKTFSSNTTWERKVASPSALAVLFMKMPEVAELVVKELDPADTKVLMLGTELAITTFCLRYGGGIDRYVDISREGKKRRNARERLPNLPRLLADKWWQKLLGKRLIAEDAIGDEMVRTIFLLIMIWRPDFPVT